MRKKFQLFQRKLALKRRKRAHEFKRASRHPFAVPVITLIVLLLVSGGVLALVKKTHRAPLVEAQIVIISHDHQKQVVPSREPTVGALLTKLGISLDSGDVVEPAATTKIDQDQFRVNIYRAVPVEIVDGSQKTFTFSAATTPRSIARQTGYTVYPEDLVSTHPARDFIKEKTIGEQVVINRATPVNLNLYGTPLVIRTQATTVGDLIKQKAIKLASSDQILPAENTLLTPNAQVFIVRNGIKIESVTEDIAMPIQTIQDPSLAYGTSAVRQVGSPGKQVVTYQDSLQNGVVVRRTVIQTIVLQPAVTQIVVVGNSLSGIKGDMALAGIAPGDYNYVDYIVSHESGWCPTKAQGEHYCPSVPDNSMTPNGYGLCQATPGSKMVSAGADWATNPITQLRWCSGYAHARYGSWYSAYTHWVSYHSW